MIELVGTIRYESGVSFNAQRSFENGQHGDVLRRVRPPGRSASESLALIGSFAFLGRLDEATALWAARGEALQPAQRARARFAIAVAYTRISKFKTARRWLRENLDDAACAKCADVFQGLAVYQYYFGRFEKAAGHAKTALSLAIENGDAYIHAFAIDLYGHALVQTGRRSLGLQKLSEARALAGRRDATDPFAVASLLYEAEAGYRPQTIVPELETLIGTFKADDSYTRANLTLELARQLTIRGQWARARQILDAISPAIYAFQNRRQETLLLLRLGELAYRTGDGHAAHHFVQSARRCLSKIADSAYEVRVLGLDAKIEKRFFGREPAPEHQKRLAELSELNPKSTGARIYRRGLGLATSVAAGDDLLGDLLDRAMSTSDQRETALAELRERGYLGLLPDVMGWTPGRPTLSLLADGNWIAVSSSGVFASVSALTPLSARLLRALAKGATRKSQLVKAGWTYTYDPLRHDPMIYTALATLRRSLGPVDRRRLGPRGVRSRDRDDRRTRSRAARARSTDRGIG